MRFLISIILSLMISSGLHAKPEVDCSFKYRISGATDIRVCSHQSLSRSDLQFITNTVHASPSLYAKFISKQKIALRRIDIAVTTVHAINTEPSFDASGVVVGRYYPGDKRVYITRDTIVNRQSVLAHEIAHLLNHLYGIEDRETDERLAYSFEEYIASR